jgi:hypothetical protein
MPHTRLAVMSTAIGNISSSSIETHHHASINKRAHTSHRVGHVDDTLVVRDLGDEAARVLVLVTQWHAHTQRQRVFVILQ